MHKQPLRRKSASAKPRPQSKLTKSSTRSIATRTSTSSVSAPLHTASTQSITTSSRLTTPSSLNAPLIPGPQSSLTTTTRSKASTPFTTARRFKRQKTYFITGPFFEQCNDKHPVPDGDLFYIENIPIAAQFKNQYSRSIKVPCLLTSEDQRSKQSTAIHQSNNRILNTLKDQVATAEKNGKPFYLVDLPMTPDYSLDPQKLYKSDPDEYNLPSNKYLQDGNGAGNKGWGSVLDVKVDMLELWLDQHPGRKFTQMAVHTSGDQLAGAQTNRVSQLIQNRIKNPDLYHAFGLDENVYQTRLTMYALHVWLYCRAVQYRPVYNGESYRKAIITVLDNTSQSSLYYDFKFLNGKDRHSMIQLLLPWYRTFMINLDKAFTSLVGGDPEPMYGLLYRTLYRTSEPDRMDPKKTAPFVDKALLRGFPYSPDVEVFMLDPPSLTHLNALVNYMVNASFDMHTKSPRDYNLMLNGFIDMIDWPSTKQSTTTTTTATPPVAPQSETKTEDQKDKIEPAADSPAASASTTPYVQKLITPPSTDGIKSEAPSAVKPHVELHKGRNLLKPLTRDEMIRWSYPVFQAQKSPFMPGFFKRIVANLFPSTQKIDKENWFLNPRDEGSPAWRPPQFALTDTGRKE